MSCERVAKYINRTNRLNLRKNLICDKMWMAEVALVKCVSRNSEF